MKKLLIALLFFTNFALAEEPGCYVSIYNPSACYNSEIKCTLDRDLNYRYGGFVFGKVCDHLLDAINDVLINSESLNKCYNDYGSTEANRLQWITYANAQEKLAKKLRKACGTRCRNIR